MDFERAGVVGAGTMGVGIAYVLALSGAQVWLIEPDDHQRERALRVIGDRAVKASQRLDADPRTTGLSARVGLAAKIEDLPMRLDVIIEAVPEQLALKRAVIADARQRQPRLLGTNTSSLSIASMVGSSDDPESLVGLHFFNPVWTMRLLEIVRTARTTPDTVELALQLAAQLKKEAIVVADLPGFATSRLGVALGLEAMRMLEDGVASAGDIDKAMELGYRHPMGPLRLTDLVGLDVRLDIARHLETAYGGRFTPPRILLDKVSRGGLGQKSGQGFYPWLAPTEERPKHEHQTG